MQSNPKPELIDEENPEWTMAMLSEAKTAAQLFTQLLMNNKSKDCLDYLHIQKVKQQELGEPTKTLAQVKEELG
ncbi:MAG: hypothetical protein WAX77_06055 [Methylococcaceae bacterium]